MLMSACCPTRLTQGKPALVRMRAAQAHVLQMHDCAIASHWSDAPGHVGWFATNEAGGTINAPPQKISFSSWSVASWL
jgi:hypothetical protein